MAQLILIFQSYCTNHMFDALQEVGAEFKIIKSKYIYIWGDPLKTFTLTYICTIGRLCVA